MLFLRQPYRIPERIFPNAGSEARAHRIQHDVASHAPQVFVGAQGVVVEATSPYRDTGK